MFISRPARAPLILAMSSESSGCSFSSTIGTRAIWFLFKIRVLEVTYPKEWQSSRSEIFTQPGSLFRFGRNQQRTKAEPANQDRISLRIVRVDEQKSLS